MAASSQKSASSNDDEEVGLLCAQKQFINEYKHDSKDIEALICDKASKSSMAKSSSNHSLQDKKEKNQNSKYLDECLKLQDLIKNSPKGNEDI